MFPLQMIAFSLPENLKSQSVWVLFVCSWCLIFSFPFRALHIVVWLVFFVLFVMAMLFVWYFINHSYRILTLFCCFKIVSSILQFCNKYSGGSLCYFPRNQFCCYFWLSYCNVCPYKLFILKVDLKFDLYLNKFSMCNFNDTLDFNFRITRDIWILWIIFWNTITCIHRIIFQFNVTDKKCASMDENRQYLWFQTLTKTKYFKMCHLHT